MAEMNRIPEAAKKAPQTTQEKNESEIDLVELFYRLVEKAKYIIACALLGDPPVIILDEPTVGLDPKQIIEIRELIRSLGQEHTVLLSSHITSDLDKIADNITFIHRGRVLLSEGRDELIDRHGVLRCTEEQLNALDPDAVRAVRKGAFGCEALVKRDGIPENWPVEPVSVEQIMLFLTRGEEA